MPAKKKGAKAGAKEAPAKAPEADPLDDGAPAYVHFDEELAKAKEEAAADREAHSLSYESAAPADPRREVVDTGWRGTLLQKANEGDEDAQHTVASLVKGEEEAKQFALLGYVKEA